MDADITLVDDIVDTHERGVHQRIVVWVMVAQLELECVIVVCCGRVGAL